MLLHLSTGYTGFYGGCKFQHPGIIAMLSGTGPYSTTLMLFWFISTRLRLNIRTSSSIYITVKMGQYCLIAVEGVCYPILSLEHCECCSY